MRIQKVFARFKGVVPPGAIALGADLDPNVGAPGPVPLAPNPELTNLIACGVVSMTNVLVKRIAVSAIMPVGGVALSARMWFYDSVTAHWYALEAAKNLTMDEIQFFAIAALGEARATEGNFQNPSAGAAQAVLVIDDAGGAPAGEYIFGMAPSLT
jgi:hypothetical protein